MAVWALAVAAAGVPSVDEQRTVAKAAALGSAVQALRGARVRCRSGVGCGPTRWPASSGRAPAPGRVAATVAGTDQRGSLGRTHARASAGAFPRLRGKETVWHDD